MTICLFFHPWACHAIRGPYLHLAEKRPTDGIARPRIGPRELRAAMAVGRQLATMGRKSSATGWNGCPNRPQANSRVGPGCRSTTCRMGGALVASRGCVMNCWRILCHWGFVFDVIVPRLRSVSETTTSEWSELPRTGA